jgi:medium-chain acyl-[acyl-carrier-protein] hydrolase
MDQPIYRKQFTLYGNDCDCFGRVKPATILGMMQESAGEQCADWHMSWEEMAEKDLFWAITRQTVEITRLPRAYETITIETWPMPATRVAYPRATIAYDAEGNELFRCIALWILMELSSRAMVVPGRSGIDFPGCTRGGELPSPKSLTPKNLPIATERKVRFGQLDRNGHMNNTRYLDWLDDLLPSQFHLGHTPRELLVCYLNESREGQTLDLCWDFLEDGCLQVDAHRDSNGKDERVFSARVFYG